MQRRTLLSLLCSLPALTLLSTAGCSKSGSTASFHAIDITGNADFGNDFRLPDADGRERTLADFRGKVVTLFFGYLNCPDYCPTHLARQKEVLHLLGDDANKVETLFVTIDPERDQPAALKQYLAAFDTRFIGLRGDAEQTARIAKAFKVSYAKQPAATPNAPYAMSHSTLTMVFDSAGRLRLAARHEEPAADLAEDLRTLLQNQ